MSNRYQILSALLVFATCTVLVTAQPLTARITQQLKAAGTEVTVADFPVTVSQTGTLELQRRRSPVDAHTKWVVPTRDGDKEVKCPIVALFSGVVAGVPGSKVWIAYAASTEQMYGIVQYVDGSSYVLGPDLRAGANEAEHLITATSAIKLPKHTAFSCAVAERSSDDIRFESTQQMSAPRVSKRDMTPELLATQPLLQVEVAVETDVEFFLATGGTLEKAQAYTAALYSVLSAIYEDEVRVKVHLPWVKTWTNDPADPYKANGDPFVLRDAAIPYWKNNYQSVSRDVYQVITSTSFGSGGFGYYDALCSKNGDFGLSSVSVQGYNALPTFAFSYDVYILAHELGHNFNADHTHACSWNPPLDTCLVDEGIASGCFTAAITAKPNPGSIMSYCGGTNNANGLGYQVRMTFLPQVAMKMRATAEAAVCLTAPGTSVLSLLSPHGEEAFASNERINIRWRATADVSKVRLEFSPDGGASWLLIENDVDATLETYSWLIETMCSNRMLVRIVSTTQPTLADTSTKTFVVTDGDDPDGLVAWYPIYRNSDDETPCGFYPAYGTAVLAPDRFNRPNNAYQFSGSTNLSVYSFKTNFDLMTIALWFKVDDRDSVQQLVGQDWRNGSTFMMYSWQGTLGAALYVEGNGVPFQIWGPQLTPDKWYHAVYTYDGYKTKLYVDGVRVADQDKTGALQKNTSPLYIGSRGNTEYTRGTIDDVRIYRRALSDAEVETLFESGIVNGITEESKGSSMPISVAVDGASCNVSVNTTLAGLVELALYDRLGKCVAAVNAGYRDAGNQQLVVEVPSVATGLYYLVAKSGAERSTAIVVIAQ